MNSNTKIVLSSVLLLSLLSGCNLDDIEGKDKDVKKPETPIIETPIQIPIVSDNSKIAELYIGSKVSNFDYSCKLNGKTIEKHTDNSGNIICEKNSNVSIKLGQMQLLSFTLSDDMKFDYLNILSDKDRSLDIDRLLLALDSDNNINNGIFLNRSITDKLTSNLNPNQLGLIEEIENLLVGEIIIPNTHSFINTINTYLKSKSTLPVGISKVFTFNEDNSVSSILEAIPSTDGGNVTFEIFDFPLNGSISLNNNKYFTYVPNKNFNGVDSFTFITKDSNGVSYRTLINLNVSPAKDQFKIEYGDVFMLKNTIYNGKLFFSNPDNENYKFTKISPLNNDNVDIQLSEDGSFTVTPKANFNGSIKFEYSVQNLTSTYYDNGSSDILILNSLTDVIALNPVDFDLQEDNTLEKTIQVINPTNVTLSNLNIQQNQNGIFEGTILDNYSIKIKFTPNSNYHGAFNSNYAINNVQNVLHIDVESINDSPVISSPLTFTLDEDTNIKGTVVATDVDGDKLIFSVLNTENGTTVMENNGSFVFTPTPDFQTGFGDNANFNYQVKDGNNSTDSNIVNFNVTNVYDQFIPIGIPTALTYVIDMNLSDIPSNILNVILFNPDKSSVNITNINIISADGNATLNHDFWGSENRGLLDITVENSDLKFECDIKDNVSNVSYKLDVTIKDQ